MYFDMLDFRSLLRQSEAALDSRRRVRGNERSQWRVRIRSNGPTEGFRVLNCIMDADQARADAALAAQASDLLRRGHARPIRMT
jgi:hypothetical protein